jgi:hypothetical protein
MSSIEEHDQVASCAAVGELRYVTEDRIESMPNFPSATKPDQYVNVRVVLQGLVDLGMVLTFLRLQEGKQRMCLPRPPIVERFLSFKRQIQRYRPFCSTNESNFVKIRGRRGHRARE